MTTPSYGRVTILPENQDAKVAQVLFYGELTVNNRRKHGVLSGITQSDLTLPVQPAS